jgi:hypothetical protein
MEKNNPINSYADELSTRIWKTKGSRFNAARRLSNKNQLSITSISILSIYGVIIPIIQIIFASSQCLKLNNWFTFISIFLSIFILVLSLLEGSKNYQVKAERLYNNATKLATIYRDLEYLKARNLEHSNLEEKLKNILNEYDRAIESCPENHDTKDYELFKAQHRREFKINILEAKWNIFKGYIQDYWLYYLFIIVPPSAAVLVVYRFFNCS